MAGAVPRRDDHRDLRSSDSHRSSPIPRCRSRHDCDMVESGSRARWAAARTAAGSSSRQPSAVALLSEPVPVVRPELRLAPAEHALAEEAHIRAPLVVALAPVLLGGEHLRPVTLERDQVVERIGVELPRRRT